MKISSSKRLRVASRHSPRLPLGQKRREHVQEALVKETGWNDEVAGSEQRGCSLLEEMSVIPPISLLCYTERETAIPHTEDEHTITWPISPKIFITSEKELFLVGSLCQALPHVLC